MIHGQTVKILRLSVRPLIHRKLNDGVMDTASMTVIEGSRGFRPNITPDS